MRRAWLLALILSALGARSAAAQPRLAPLVEARARMDALAFEEASTMLDAVARAAETSAAHRLEALVLLTECHVALEQLDRADDAARRVYALDPAFVPARDPAPPRRVLRVLESAREAAPPPVEVVLARPRLVHDDPSHASLVVEVTRGGEAVERVLFRVRSRGPSERVLVGERRGTEHRAALGTDPGRVRYTIEARAPSGAVRASLGPFADGVDASRPVAEESSGGLWRSPVLWATAGAIVVGIVVAAVAVNAEPGCDESLRPGGTVCLR